MTIDPRLAVFAIMVLLALVESVFPFRRSEWRRGHLAANLGLTAATITLNFVFGAATAGGAEALRARGFGLGAGGTPSLLLLVAGVALLDLSTYAAHRLMHATALWRVHRVHHADPFVDVTTAYRQHPLETLVRAAFIAVPAWTLGLPAATIAAYRVLSAANALAEHANVRVWPRLDAALSLLFVTPNMHKVHHSRRPPETDSNYGNLLALYDRLLGTFTPSARSADVQYGLDGYDTCERQGLGALLRAPFERDQAAAEPLRPAGQTT
jgi:sterol desaturase/sphingolipid hydroxylase (fatty acid hydroxylase superfamily)